MATQTAHPQRANARLWLFALIGAAMLSILPLTLLSRDGGDSTTPPLLDSSSARVAYIEFGATSDIVWLASANNPKARQRVGVIPHAQDFGANAALSPDASQIAYTSLAPTMKPAPDAPADLWLQDLSVNGQPVQLASSVDLLVRPLWSTDGRSLVYRRSSGGGSFDLYVYDIAAQTERSLLHDSAALFPISFTATNDAIYYVTVRSDASDLHRLDIATGETATVAHLADTLTRDWVISPAGDRLAYLEMAFNSGQVSSQGRVIEIATGQFKPAYTAGANAFSPVWRTDGGLTLGRDSFRGEATGASLQWDDTLVPLPEPEKGFDVPLGWSADNYLAVRSFEGSSASDPGRATLQVVAENGGRTTIANGEVTFLGWINP